MTLLGAAFACLATPQAWAHGSVALEDDLCAIKIGYYRAHFRIYLPETDRHEQYCEDVPSTGSVVFVMEYQHSGLSSAPIDFRIIENVTDMGTFARWEHVQQIEDLDAVTVFYRERAVTPDVLMTRSDFGEGGEYIGIVTAEAPDGQVYRAVFPFEVGFAGLGYWPIFLALAVALQLNYLFMSGHFDRWRKAGLRPVESHGGR